MTRTSARSGVAVLTLEANRIGREQMEATMMEALVEDHTDRSEETEPVNRREKYAVPTLGFFAGVAYLFTVPALIMGAFGTVTPQNWEEAFNPFAFLSLLVPVALLIPPRTRLFALYMIVGMVSGIVLIAGLVITFMLLVESNKGGY